MSNIENFKRIQIDFLYLDLSTCDRCMETEGNLDEAIRELTVPFTSIGFAFEVNKVNVVSEELANKYKLESSPTIRVNGNDILGEIRENFCSECSEISGDNTECRVFEYDGKEYNEPPKAMIIDGILKALYGNKVQNLSKEYNIPENIKSFLKGFEKSSCGCSCGSDSCC